MSQYLWLVFVKNLDLLKDPKNELAIPYDCEFIIIQSHSRGKFKLKEIYKIENRTFLLDFGTLDSYKGLKTKNLFLYIRRRNLNQSEIVIVFDVSLKIVQNF